MRLVSAYLSLGLCLAGQCASAAVPAFDGAEAKSWVERQCLLGPRVVGSKPHAECIRLIESALDSAGLAHCRVSFETVTPLGPRPTRVTNILASVRPEARPRLLLGAHFDSRPWADRDPDPARRKTPVLGANDGGSGTAVLLTLARILAENPPPFGVDLAFFDAEDLGREDHPEEFCLGSQWMAENWVGDLPDFVLVLDMVGSDQVEFGRELYSQQVAPEWVDLLFQVAVEAGYGEWNPSLGHAIVDDHVAFLRQGVPSSVWIGWGDPAWHTGRDVPSAVSERRLGRVGDLVCRLIYGGYLTTP